MKTKFRELRFLSGLFKMIGGIELVFGIISMILLPLSLSNADSALTQLGLLNVKPGTGLVVGIVGGIVILFIGFVSGLLTYALGELFTVVLAIEENTRTMAVLKSKE